MLELVGCELFQGFAREEALALIRRLQPEFRHFQDREFLATEGDAANHLLIIGNGSVMVSANRGDQMVTVFAMTVSEPTVIGEQALLEADGARTANLCALGPVDAHLIYRDAIEGLADKGAQAKLWRNIAKIVSRKLASATRQRAQLIASGDRVRGLVQNLVNPHGLNYLNEYDRLRTEYEEIRAAIWFSDLVGFSSLAKGMAPEETA